MDSSKRCSPSQNGQFDLVVVVPVPCSKLPGHFVAKQTAGFPLHLLPSSIYKINLMSLSK